MTAKLEVTVSDPDRENFCIMNMNVCTEDRDITVIE